MTKDKLTPKQRTKRQRLLRIERTKIADELRGLFDGEVLDRGWPDMVLAGRHDRKSTAVFVYVTPRGEPLSETKLAMRRALVAVGLDVVIREVDL